MKGALNIRIALTHTTAAAAEAEEDTSLPGERVLEVSVKHCTTSNACMAVISTPVISCCSVRRASRMAVIRSGPSYSTFCACVWFVFGAQVCAREAMELAKHADMGSLHGAGMKHM
jgi:hypothetical protein